MASSDPVLLPSPLPVDSFKLGQLLTDPLNPSSQSFISESHQTHASEPSVHSKYRAIVSHDDEGRLLSNLSGRPIHPARPNLLVLQADEMTLQSLNRPHAAFNALRKDSQAQSFMLEMARRNQPLYYVVGLQSLKNPTLARAAVNDQDEIFPTDKPTKVELSRRDSAMDVTESKTDALFGLVVRKVKCFVGPRDEPHSLEDIDLQWSYHDIAGAEELQLSIGLGEALGQKDLRSLAGLVDQYGFDEEEQGSEVSYFSDDDSEGLSGF